MTTIERVFDKQHDFQELMDLIVTEVIYNLLHPYYDKGKVNTATSHYTGKE